MDKKNGNAGKKRFSNSDSSYCGTNGNNLKLLLYSTLSFIFPCRWWAAKSIFHIDIRHYSETWMIEIIKSCSSDDAKMASTELVRQQNVKQRRM